MIYVVITTATAEGDIETQLVGPFGNAREAQNWIETLDSEFPVPEAMRHELFASISVHTPVDPETVDGTAEFRHEDTDQGAV